MDIPKNIPTNIPILARGLKEWILSTKFWANTYMTKIVMKFPPYIEKILSEIIKFDKPHD